MDKFNYLGVMISTDGGVGEEVAHRVFEGRKVWGTKAKLWKENVISRDVKRGLYINRSLWFGDVVIKCTKRRKIKVFEMMCLRNICGIRRVDRVRNAIIRERCGCELSLLERIERNVLKWFRHVERKGKERRKF